MNAMVTEADGSAKEAAADKQSAAAASQPLTHVGGEVGKEAGKEAGKETCGGEGGDAMGSSSSTELVEAPPKNAATTTADGGSGESMALVEAGNLEAGNLVAGKDAASPTELESFNSVNKSKQPVVLRAIPASLKELNYKDEVDEDEDEDKDKDKAHNPWEKYNDGKLSQDRKTRVDSIKTKEDEMKTSSNPLTLIATLRKLVEVDESFAPLANLSVDLVGLVQEFNKTNGGKRMRNIKKRDPKKTEAIGDPTVEDFLVTLLDYYINKPRDIEILEREKEEITREQEARCAKRARDIAFKLWQRNREQDESAEATGKLRKVRRGSQGTLVDDSEFQKPSEYKQDALAVFMDNQAILSRHDYNVITDIDPLQYGRDKITAGVVRKLVKACMKKESTGDDSDSA